MGVGCFSNSYKIIEVIHGSLAEKQFIVVNRVFIGLFSKLVTEILDFFKDHKNRENVFNFQAELFISFLLTTQNTLQRVTV